MNEQNNLSQNTAPRAPQIPPVNMPYNPAVKPKPEKKIYPFNNKDFYFLIFAVVSVFAFVRLGVFEVFNLGLTITYTLLSLGIFIYVRSKEAKNKVFNSILFIMNIILSASFALHDNEFIKFLTVFVLFFTTVMSLNGFNGTSLCNDGTFVKMGEVMYIGVAEPFLNFPALFSSLKSVFKTKNNKFVMVIAGVLISVPVLLIVIPLLSSADMAFNTIVEKVFENTAMLILSLLVTIIILPFVTSYGFSLANGVVKDKNKSFNAKEGKVSPVFLNTFLCIIGFIYIVFLVSQLAYISDAFSFLLPEGFSAAEFARSGFFQMGAIAFINLVITFLVSALEKPKDNGKLPISTKLILTFFTLFSIFLTVNAFIRMSMYIEIYGLTQLRVLTSIFMVMLCVIFVIILIRIFNEKFKYINLVLFVCAVTFIFVSVGNIDAVISKYNYQKYIEGEIELDFEHYETLGNSAVPELIKIAESDNSKLNRYLAQDTLANILYNEFDEDLRYDTDSESEAELFKYDSNVFGYNISRYKGGKALEKYFETAFDNGSSIPTVDYEMYEYTAKVAEIGATGFMPDFSDPLDDVGSANFEYDVYDDVNTNTVELSLFYDEVDYKTAVGKINSRFVFGKEESAGDYTFKMVKDTGVENCVGFIGFCEKEGTITYFWAKCDEPAEIESLSEFIDQNFYLYFVESVY